MINDYLLFSLNIIDEGNSESFTFKSVYKSLNMITETNNIVDQIDAFCFSYLPLFTIDFAGIRP